MKARICAFVGAALGGIATSEAFVFSPSAVGIRHRASTVRQQPAQAMTAEPKVVRKAVTVAKGEAEEEDETGKWDGKSIPKKKEEYLGLPDEASHWEVEEARVEVWEDYPNPPLKLEWAGAFEPSGEEMQAAGVGFDWIHTDKWLAVDEEEPAKKDAKKATMKAD